jgi:hypothetical protein
MIARSCRDKSKCYIALGHQGLLPSRDYAYRMVRA